MADIDSSSGVLLLALVLAAILYGLGVCQTFLYFYWHPLDSLRIKLLVVVLSVLQTAQIIFYARASYLMLFTWNYWAQLLCIYISTFLVHGHFIHSIWTLCRIGLYRVWPAYLSAVFALTSFGAGIAQIYMATRLKSWDELESTKVEASIKSGFTFVCDVAIGAALCAILHVNRVREHRSQILIKRLIIYSVNRGLVTSLCAAMSLVLFLVNSRALWYQLVLVPSGNVYVNSLLASLNTRENLRRTDEMETFSVRMQSRTRSMFAPNADASSLNEAGVATGAVVQRVQVIASETGDTASKSAG